MTKKIQRDSLYTGVAIWHPSFTSILSLVLKSMWFRFLGEIEHFLCTKNTANLYKHWYWSTNPPQKSFITIIWALDEQSPFDFQSFSIYKVQKRHLAFFKSQHRIALLHIHKKCSNFIFESKNWFLMIELHNNSDKKDH